MKAWTTHLFSPRGIPADYRHMQGLGVNTYKFVNARGETCLVKYHWEPRQGVTVRRISEVPDSEAARLAGSAGDANGAPRAGGSVAPEPSLVGGGRRG